MPPLKSNPPMNSEPPVESGSEDFDMNSDDDSDDRFDDEVPCLSSFETTGAPGQKRKNQQENGSLSIKKFKGNVASKKAPLTAEELIYLKETENLFQSNVFRLQISELISETKPKRKYRRHFDVWLAKLEQFLNSLPDSKERELKKDIRRLEKRGVKVPLFYPEDISGVFKFTKPTKTLAVGSFSIGTSVGAPYSADLVLVMPKSLFKKGDKFDLLYLIKRALYLSHVAAWLRQSDLLAPGTSVEFITPLGDALKPCLILRPNEQSARALEVVISAVPEAGTFKLTQFTPDKCNITSVSQSDFGSTPHYNSTLCEDLVLEENENVKKSVFESSQNLKDAAILLGVWLRQRNLLLGYGAFNMHIVCMYLAQMVKDRRINLSMSSNQIIRTVWLDLSKNDWTSAGSMLFKDTPDANNPSADIFHSQQEVVFIDATGFHNLTFRMSSDVFFKIKKEATHAINLLNRSDSNCFQSLFLKSSPFLHQYDNALCFQDAEVIARAINKFALPKLKIDFCLQNVPIFVRTLLPLLKKALGARLDSVGISYPETCRWQLSGISSAYSLTDKLVFGLKFNPDTSLLVIDKGPIANSPEGVEFRSFWGDKCELRRFKDGSISESVIWGKSSLPVQDRRKIVKNIVSYVLSSKLRISEGGFDYVGFELCKLYQLNFAPLRSIEESSVFLHKVFTRVSQDLHNFKLPLEIVSVHCISESYRFTDPFPPIKSHFKIAKAVCDWSQNGFLLKKDKDVMLPPYTPSVDLVVQMSISGKWPENANACKRLVAAFYVEIYSAFKAKYRTIRMQVTPDYLIVFKDGFIFRIFLAYSKQIAILKKRVSELGLKQYRDTEESIAIEKKFINLPKLTGALYGLSQLYSGFGPTCVLAKRWVSSHLFHETHVPNVVIELLVAHLFTSSQPVEVTMHPLPMFLRLLKMLSSTNWHLEPIVVNFNDSLDRSTIADIEKYFNTNRETLPPMFIATPFDTTGVLWTRKAPTIPVLVRLARLASVSLKILESTLGDGSPSDQVLKIFEAPLSVFHMVINLDLKVATRRHFSIDFDEVLAVKNAKAKSNLPVHNVDPVLSFVEDLEENYSDQALFFYDKYGGSKIGVLLKPSYTPSSPFKVSSFNGRKLVDVDGEVHTKPDVHCLIDGFKLLGSGVIDNVTVNPIFNL